MSVVRHTAATKAEAIRLRDAGWTARAIRRMFAKRGIHVQVSTITYWTSEKAMERRRKYDLERAAAINAERATFRWPGRPRTEAWYLGRMRVLDGAGLSPAAISRVFRVDHGLELTEHQVRYALASGSIPVLRRNKDAGSGELSGLRSTGASSSVAA